MKKYFTVLFALFLLTACTPVQYNYVPSHSQIDFPIVNKETIVHVGDAMLIQGKMYDAEYLNIISHIDGTCYDVPAGAYHKTGFSDDREFFSPRGSTGNVTRGAMCDPIGGISIRRSKPNEICVVTTIGATSCYEGSYTVQRKKVPIADTVQRSLYFSGVKGNDIAFMYTEKAGIETVHTHNVTYNLKESPIIGYKGAQIEVIKATNESITYKILKKFP